MAYPFTYITLAREEKSLRYGFGFTISPPPTPRPQPSTLATTVQAAIAATNHFIQCNFFNRLEGRFFAAILRLLVLLPL